VEAIMHDTRPVPPPRGRPRSEKARQAILAAAAGLLLERGLAEVSMDAVAERAGVSKATIYRWWPAKETLALDALYTRWAEAGPAPAGTGTLRGDLLELLLPWARLVRTGPHARVITALLAKAANDPAFAEEYRRHVIQPRRDQARQLLLRAVDRKEIPADTETEIALDLIYGPLYHRLLHGHAPLSDDFVRQALDLALTGISGAPR
jgi:AcrR family transcriptional regulator